MRRPLLFLLAAALPLLLYARTAGFDFVQADDADLIAGNEAFLSDWRNVPRAFTRSYFQVEGDLTEQETYYRPVAIVSFMVDAARGGAHPRPYHVTNVMLHAVATSLLLALAMAWGAPAWAALSAAAVFAVHPVNAQAVAWIAGRNDLLLAVFGLIALLSWVWMGGAAAAREGRRRGRPVVSAAVTVHVVAFALALFSKETGVFFPFVAVLHQRLVRRERLRRRHWIALGVDGAIAAAWMLLRAQALAGMPSEVSATTLRAVLFNLPQLLVHTGKMLAPVRLNVSPGVDSIDVAAGGLAVLLFALLARRWLSRDVAIVAACWVLMFVLPTLVVLDLPVYEHRAYVPLIGVLLVSAAGLVGRHRQPSTRRLEGSESLRLSQVSSGLQDVSPRRRRGKAMLPLARRSHMLIGPRRSLAGLGRRLVRRSRGGGGSPGEGGRRQRGDVGRPPTGRQVLGVGVVAIVGLFATLTHQRLDVFQNPFTYWSDAARDTEFGPIAHVNLGQLHEAAGHQADARREYVRALELNPSTPKAHNNLGVVLMAAGEPDLALAHFREETVRHPWNADAWFNLGLWTEMRGNPAAARPYYERAIGANRRYLPAYEKLGRPPPE